MTCLSQQFYNEHLSHFKDCPKFPVVNLQVHGFTGEKSVKVKIQVRAKVEINGLKTDLNFLIIPRLVRPCILGIDSQKDLGVLLDVRNEQVTFRIGNQERTLQYQESILLCMQIEYIHHIGVEENEEIEEQELWEETIKKMKNLEEFNNNEVPSFEEMQAKVDELEELTDEHKRALIQLLWKFREIFRKAPGRFKNYEHTLIVTDEKPFFQKSYPIPMQYREKVDLEIERMLAYGIIERSTTPFINPMLPVNKSDGSVRLCMDARELNKRLQPDRDGPEEMEEVLRKCTESKVMSSIDLTASFWQVPLNEKSKKYCGFKHGGKTYHHNVLPFGTCVSSAGLTRAAEKPLKGLDFVIDFVDDWLIISSDMSQHLEHLEKLFTRILL